MLAHVRFKDSVKSFSDLWWSHLKYLDPVKGYETIVPISISNVTHQNCQSKVILSHFEDVTRKDGLWTPRLVRSTIGIEVNVAERSSEAQGCVYKQHMTTAITASHI